MPPRPACGRSWRRRALQAPSTQHSCAPEPQSCAPACQACAPSPQKPARVRPEPQACAPAWQACAPSPQHPALVRSRAATVRSHRAGRPPATPCCARAVLSPPLTLLQRAPAKTTPEGDEPACQRRRRQRQPRSCGGSLPLQCSCCPLQRGRQPPQPCGTLLPFAPLICELLKEVYSKALTGSSERGRVRSEGSEGGVPGDRGRRCGATGGMNWMLGCGG